MEARSVWRRRLENILAGGAADFVDPFGGLGFERTDDAKSPVERAGAVGSASGPVYDPWGQGKASLTPCLIT